MCGCPLRTEEDIRFPVAVVIDYVSCPTWVQKAKLGCSRRAESALNC